MKNYIFILTATWATTPIPASNNSQLASLNKSNHWRTGLTSFAWGAGSTAVCTGIIAGSAWVLKQPHESQLTRLTAGIIGLGSGFVMLKNAKNTGENLFNSHMAHFAACHEDQIADILQNINEDEIQDLSLDDFKREISSNPLVGLLCGKMSDEELTRMLPTLNATHKTFFAHIKNANLQNISGAVSSHPQSTSQNDLQTQCGTEESLEQSINNSKSPHWADSVHRWFGWGYFGGVATAVAGIVVACYKTGWFASLWK